MKIAIIIPCYNDNNSIVKLISELKILTELPIIVVDDGSIPHIEIKSSVYTIRNVVNRGKGYSLLKAFKYARLSGFTHAITLDADLQHKAELINKFVEADENHILVLGTRLFNKTMPMHRRLSNKITSSIASYLSRARITDSQCGYRRYHLESVLSQSYKEKGFQFETEVLLYMKAITSRNICEINIPTIYNNNNNSSISNISDTFKFIRLILRRVFAR